MFAVYYGQHRMSEPTVSYKAAEAILERLKHCFQELEIRPVEEVVM